MMSSMPMQDCTITTAGDAMWPPMSFDGSMDSSSSIFSDTSSQGKECKENGNEEEGELRQRGGVVWLPSLVCVAVHVSGVFRD